MSYFSSNAVPKSQEADKSAATFHYFHSNSEDGRVWNQNYRQYVCIDPAHKNFALRIERRYFDGRILPVAFGKYDIYGEIVSDPKKKATKNIKELTSTTFSKLNSRLDTHLKHYDQVHFVLVERQLPKNHKMVKVMQHVIAYFSVVMKNMPLLPWIVEIDPKLKNRIFNFGKCDYNECKKKSIALALELLGMRQDQTSIDIMNFWKSKKDDLADVVVMIEAFCIWMGFERTKKIESDMDDIEESDMTEEENSFYENM